MKGNLYKTAILIMLSVFIFSCIFVSPAAAADPFTMKGDHKRGFDTSANKHTLNGNESVQLFSKKDIYFKNSAEFTADIPKSMKEYVILLDSSGSLKPEIPKDNPFDYALFSGNTDTKTTLNLQASGIKIDGKTHSNSNVNIAASSVTTASESFQYVNKRYQTGGIDPKLFVPHSAIDMPDMDQKLKDPKYGLPITINEENYKNHNDSNSTFKKLNQNVNIKYNTEGEDIKSVKLTFGSDGNIIKADTVQTHENIKAFRFDGSSFVIGDKQTYYFEGNVVISNGLDIQGTGMIIATGDIIIKGQNLNITGSSSGLLYSVNKRIILQQDSVNMNGILYAPHGSMIMQGTQNNIKGNVVGKDIVSLPGTTNIKFDNSSGISGKVKDAIGSESYFSNALDTAVKLIGKIDTPCKIGVIKYDLSANGNPDYDLKIINNELELTNFITDKKDKIKSADNGQSNLGDGIRRAYYMLKNSGSSTAQKSIIVFPGIKPNVCTTATSSGDSAFTGLGDAPNDLLKKDIVETDSSAGDGESSDGSLKISSASMNADKYAKEMAYLAASDGITPYFINYVPDANSKKIVRTAINGSDGSDGSDISEGIVQYIKAKVPALNKPILYFEAIDETTLSDVIKNQIAPVDSYNVEIEFSFKLPKSVVPGTIICNGKPGWLKINPVTGAVEGKCSTSIANTPAYPKKYTFSDTSWADFNINVKFNNSKRVKNGYSEDYKFMQGDNYIKYTIKYNDGDTPMTQSFTTNYPKLDVTSLYKIEIQ